MQAVQFDRYGDRDVLIVRNTPRPVAGQGEVIVRVKAAGINPGEAAIRNGLFHARWPATFPSGQGSDLAGQVVETGEGVTSFSVGDEVFGFTNKRASHAAYVCVPTDQLVPKPSGVSWDVAGALFVAGTTAYASVREAKLRPSDVVVIAGATGGVGVIATQLAKRAGATVIGIASARHDDWLLAHGAIPVNYGENLSRRLLAVLPSGRVDAFLDCFGGGYVEVAVRELGVSPKRINTIADFPAVEMFGVSAAGSAAAANTVVLAELADLIAAGELEVPIARHYALDEVREAYRELEMRHTNGKIVLRP